MVTAVRARVPLAYEVLPGNTADNQTLRQFSQQDRDAVRQGPARLGDGSRHSHERGGVLAEMRQSDPPVRYLVGTPKGRLTPVGAVISSTRPWQEAQPGCPGQTAGPVTASSMSSPKAADRVLKERAMHAGAAA